MVIGMFFLKSIVLDSTVTNLLGVGQPNKNIKFPNRLSSGLGNDNVTDLDKATFPHTLYCGSILHNLFFLKLSL